MRKSQKMNFLLKNSSLLSRRGTTEKPLNARSLHLHLVAKVSGLYYCTQTREGLEKNKQKLREDV